jgi:hypothetical protein
MPATKKLPDPMFVLYAIESLFWLVKFSVKVDENVIIAIDPNHRKK